MKCIDCEHHGKGRAEECHSCTAYANLRRWNIEVAKAGNYETVNHPPHYNQHPAGIECIDVIEHFPANIAFAMKHEWRAGLKPGTSAIEDLDKAIWYLEREKERLSKCIEST